VSDRLPRRQVLLVTALYRTAILLALALLTAHGAELGWVLAAVAAAGVAAL